MHQIFTTIDRCRLPNGIVDQFIELTLTIAFIVATGFLIVGIAYIIMACVMALQSWIRSIQRQAARRAIR